MLSEPNNNKVMRGHQVMCILAKPLADPINERYRKDALSGRLSGFRTSKQRFLPVFCHYFIVKWEIGSKVLTWS